MANQTVIRPLGDRVVAKKEAALAQTASGIYLGEAKEKPSYAVAESVGAEVKGVKKGDKIIFREYAGTDVRIEGVDYLIVKEEDILAVLSKEEKPRDRFRTVSLGGK